MPAPKPRLRTEGVSPKVYVPLVAGVVVGLILLVAALIAGDDTLQTAAVAVLLAVVGHAGLGYAAGPGKVVARQP